MQISEVHGAGGANCTLLVIEYYRERWYRFNSFLPNVPFWSLWKQKTFGFQGRSGDFYDNNQPRNSKWENFDFLRQKLGDHENPGYSRKFTVVYYVNH